MLICALAVTISVFSLTKSAYAHFLVEDYHTGVKAIFHINPDDDPIAGQESVISFDFSRTGLQNKEYGYSLSVKSTKNEAVDVSTDITGNVVLANYTFPSQGFYDITLTATRKENGVASKLQYGQRVSRGTVTESTETFGPVEIGIMAGTILIAVGAVIFSLNDTTIKRGRKENDTKNYK